MSFLLGCSAKTEPEPVFGGQGASIEARQTSLDQAPPEPESGPCVQARSPSDFKLIEDFEDTDDQLFKAFEREGWWYVAVDPTAGEVFPEVGAFKASALPPEEASVENRYALHGKASEFRDWGVVWGSTLRWVGDGQKCPFNASKFVGLKFRAKGKGQLHLKFGNPSTVPGEFEGKCKNQCWDLHGKKLPLSEEWQMHVVRWDRVQQGGWGAEAKFDPERLLTMNFAVDGKDLPVEFWLDDIEFIAEGEQIEPVTPPAGQGTLEAVVPATPGASSPSASSPSASSAPVPAPAPSVEQ